LVNHTSGRYRSQSRDRSGSGVAVAAHESPLRLAADAARRHPAEGTSLLLEVRVPAVAWTGTPDTEHRSSTVDIIGANAVNFCIVLSLW